MCIRDRINDYYAAQLSIETDEDRKAKAVADYKAHLSRVIAVSYTHLKSQ